MTTTACDDQFIGITEKHISRYIVEAILRQNVADLEKELQRQRERAEAAEAELLAVRDDNHSMMLELDALRTELKSAREPVAWDCGGSITANSGYTEWFSRKDHGAAVPLYTSPIPAPAAPDDIHELAYELGGTDSGEYHLEPEALDRIIAAAKAAPSVPDGDDFNGTTPHMIQCIEALVRMNDSGVLIPHGIGGHARTLLLASANRLRQQTAPSVPEEWREVMAELAADLQACIEAEHAYRDQYSSVMRKYQNDMRIVERARALLQSAEVRHD